VRSTSPVSSACPVTEYDGLVPQERSGQVPAPDVPRSLHEEACFEAPSTRRSKVVLGHADRGRTFPPLELRGDMYFNSSRAMWAKLQALWGKS
jgi:hypothetical protein